MDYDQAIVFFKETIRKTKYEASKRRNLDFDIDLAYVLSILMEQNEKCALTGWDLEFVRGGDWYGKNPHGATLDRIDSTKGYVRGNIQITCGIVNTIKSSIGNLEFINICRDVASKNAVIDTNSKL